MDPFATAEDIATRLAHDTYADAELAQVELLLTLASGLILDAVGKTEAWADEQDALPDAFRAVCIEVVVRVLLNPSGAEQTTERLGQYEISQRFPGGSGLVGITRGEARQVRRALTGSSFQAITLQTPYSDTDDDDELELPL